MSVVQIFGSYTATDRDNADRGVIHYALVLAVEDEAVWVLEKRGAGPLELVSKVSSATDSAMRAATSSVFAKKSSMYRSGYTCGFFARLPCFASHLAALATKLLLRPVLVISTLSDSINHYSGELTGSEYQLFVCSLDEFRGSVSELPTLEW